MQPEPSPFGIGPAGLESGLIGRPAGRLDREPGLVPLAAAAPIEDARASLTRPPLSNGERRIALLIAAILVLAGAALTPLARMKWPDCPGFVVGNATGSVMLDLLVVILLVAKERIEQDGTRLYLAAAYFYAALVIPAQAASFPNAFLPGILIGTASSSTWLWVFWHLGFALLIVWYGLSSMAGPHPRARLPAVALFIVALAGISLFVGLREAGHLPNLIIGRLYFTGVFGRAVMAVVVLGNLAALAAVAQRLRNGQSEDLWLAVGMIGACVDVWLRLAGAERFSLGWYCGRFCGLSTTFMVFVSLLIEVLRTYRRVVAANTVLDLLTVTDPLTQLGNRRIFDTTLRNEWRRCRRDMLPLSVVLFDVDHFKNFNDSYGHLAGDSCLEQIAGHLREAATRAGDLASRYGGEEFALILPATDSGGASYVANTVRLTVRDAGIPHASSDRGFVTVSAGIATLVPSESFDATELVRLADQALYRAKAAGRDTVTIAG